jgi:MmyB-like transcription regulator ligand binding domain
MIGTPVLVLNARLDIVTANQLGYALSTRSDDFRRRWAAHDVQIHTTGVKLIHHPVVGDLDLSYESFPLAADLSQSLLTYTAEPESPSQDALTLLANWAASIMHHSNTSEHEKT